VVLIHSKSTHEINFGSILLEVVRVLLLVVLSVEDFRENPLRELHDAVESEEEHGSEERQGHPGLPEERILTSEKIISGSGVVAANQAENSA